MKDADLEPYIGECSDQKHMQREITAFAQKRG